MRYFLVLVFVALVPLAAAHDNSQEAQEDTLVRTTQSWDGNTLPAYPEGQPEVTILKIRVPAGAQLDVHHHPVINAGVLLEGELTVVSKEGGKLNLEAGDAIVELVDTPHYGRNDGDEEAVIIVFYAGVEEKPVTVISPH
ncbi:cupin domain-containing protein [Halorhodospira halochloris]|uniref:cupin domain-containing protein n=1 Tax=Halorhodospira halochloris TaxID=1052 RepID=UPI001EE8CDFB|nr:cupin domain-containing protein [Halorhodospira halochloris]MCG5531261.1 cupin domain-containing protein [Halorhodospira halochloris]